jgi:hypothetical protein
MEPKSQIFPPPCAGRGLVMAGMKDMSASLKDTGRSGQVRLPGSCLSKLASSVNELAARQFAQINRQKHCPTSVCDRERSTAAADQEERPRRTGGVTSMTEEIATLGTRGVSASIAHDGRAR